MIPQTFYPFLHINHQNLTIDKQSLHYNLIGNLHDLTYLQCSSPIFPLSSMSTRRPGVATSKWQPLSRSLIWAPMSAPPYTTQGLTRDR